MGGTCHTFVKTRRVCNTKSGTNVNYRLHLIIMYQCQLIHGKKWTTLIQGVLNREGVYGQVGGMQGCWVLVVHFF